ncbi:MAG: Asp-tRNA(Asn)/Glu-tRNA(Gln) amidotransferase subunit GatC [Patescibacteria group bacterium]|nr:Asp-tRNA(Asn)/Glu-tRNA(Gln) amidotransferase subunit GatC [Patescibacteria group bacterium]
MNLTKEDVLHLAELARLELTAEELEHTEKELDKILGYVERLQEIDASGVEAASMSPKGEGWRKDVALACDEYTRELILANFPDKKTDLLKTPGVFEKPKG